MLTFGGKVITSNSKWIDKPIPLNTIRLRYKAGVTPVFNKGTGVCIDTSMNVWDLTYNNSNWNYLLISSILHINSNADLEEVLGGNTSNVTSMAYLFYDARSLKKVKKFDTSNVTNFDSMFWHCNSLKEIPFFDLSNATAIPAMFEWCTSITSIPQFNTSNVTDMNHTFHYCGSLKNVPLLDTSKVTSMAALFSACGSLEHAPLLDTSNVVTMTALFEYCSKLKEIPLLDTSKATNVGGICYDCYDVESGALALYNQMANQTNPPTDHLHAFYRCGIHTSTGTAELAQIPDDWK